MEVLPLKTEKYVVLYIDFLATKNAMVTTEEKTLRTFYELYQTAAFLTSTLSNTNYSDMEFRVFSDNVVIAFRNHIWQDDPDVSLLDILDALQFAAFFQIEAMLRGFLIRGGITIGNMYFDDVFIYGTGLIRAYELESKTAEFPRIIIDDCILRRIESDIDNVKMFPQGSFCMLKDIDAEWFVDYLSVLGMPDDKRIEIVNSGQTIIRNAITNPGYFDAENARIRQKIEWQIKYFSLSEKIHKEGAGNGSKETD